MVFQLEIEVFFTEKACFWGNKTLDKVLFTSFLSRIAVKMYRFYEFPVFLGGRIVPRSDRNITFFGLFRPIFRKQLALRCDLVLFAVVGKTGTRAVFGVGLRGNLMRIQVK